jgi:hypothetical protein
VVSKLAGLPFESYFHVAISTDASNPFENISNEPVFPEIYDGGSLDKNKWATIKDRFGWLNYGTLCKVANKIDRRNQSSHSSLFFESFGLNESNLAKPRCDAGIGHSSKNRILVYLPDVNTHTLLHCSFQGEKCKLRDYSIHPNGAPVIDERFHTSDMLSRAVHKLEAPRVPIGNNEFWHKEIKRLNAIHLSSFRSGMSTANMRDVTRNSTVGKHPLPSGHILSGIIF